ncbi:MAG TPA: hypothetical protein VM032_00870 [Vicinamibacterales bacterium]|nr:hypothetical protein [Vicinamibacterales bacterium]
MDEFTIGIEDHYAWANLVSITTMASELHAVLLDRRRVRLLDPHLPASPYHHDTLSMSLADGEHLVREVTHSAAALARVALAEVIDELAPARCRGIAIRVPPLPRLPASVAEAHAQAAVRNRADGMIYHQALTQAAARLELKVVFFGKGDVLEQAAQANGTTARDLERQLKALGAAGGPPWRRGQVLACAGAIFAHSSDGAAKQENS